MTEHKRIWLEPAGAPDRCWCQDNQWGDEGVEYVLATTLEVAERENKALRKALDEIRELNLENEDENGHRWANSDMINQTIVSVLAELEAP